MSLNMSNLLDIEKYFLLELSYCDNADYSKRDISPQKPIFIADFLESVPQCYCSCEIGVRKMYGNVEVYMKDLYTRLRKVYEESDNLKDIEIIGYINDNYNFLGNTCSKKKSGLVAFALRDSEGNGMVMYRGCELNYFSNIVLDWPSCVAAAVGYVTSQHKKALKFFDTYMEGISGEHNIIGHSKGGNLATYVFINRKGSNVNCYVVNAQPYCWFAMSDKQRAWLKSSQYEYIVHTDDLTKAASYVSYASRVIPLNRYLKKDTMTKHSFFSAGFDDYGNLEGGRIFRQTTSRILTRVFHDYSSEGRKTKEELLKLFRSQMKVIRSSARFLSIGMDEIMLALNAEAATLWLISTEPDNKGQYIYPFMIKGPINDELYKLKLYKGEGIAADCAFNGAVHLVEDMGNNNESMNSIDISTGFISKSTVSVPLCCDNGTIIGALQILNKKDTAVFTKDDLEFASQLAKIIGEFILNSKQLNETKDFTLLSILQEDKTIFKIERNQFLTLEFNDTSKKDKFYNTITGLELQPNEALLFNRQKFLSHERTKLDSYRRLELSEMFVQQEDRNSSETVKKVLLSKVAEVKEKQIDKSKILENENIMDILDKKISELTEHEYIRYEFEKALIIRPMLLIVDYPDKLFVDILVEQIMSKLKEITQNKTSSVVVLKSTT